MTEEKNKVADREADDFEPVCLFITSVTVNELDEWGIRNAVDGLISDFKICRTPNPFVWFFLGRWIPEISEANADRTARLVDSLKSVEGNAFVTVSFAWTNFLRYQQLAWKSWREIIS